MLKIAVATSEKAGFSHLSSGQRNSGCDDALNGGVAGQVQEQHSTLKRPVLFKVL